MLAFVTLLLATGALATPVVLNTHHTNVHYGIHEKHVLNRNKTMNQSAFSHYRTHEYQVPIHKPFTAIHDSFDHIVEVPHMMTHHQGTTGVTSRHGPSSDVPEDMGQILQQHIEVNPDGSFTNVWSSDNGINVEEQGTPKHVGETDVSVSSGQISYVDNEGQRYHLKYVADENGFRPEGEHLPTPPPIPVGIVRSLEFIAAHPFVETTTHSSQHHFLPVVIDNRK